MFTRKKILGICFVLAMASLGVFMIETKTESMILAGNNKALLKIVIPDEATMVERVVADDLAFHLGQIDRCTFEVIKESDIVKEQGFYIGRTTEGEKILKELLSQTDNIQASLLRVTSEKVVLIGATDQALSHGVYSLLHDLGCRWYTLHTWGTYVPQKDSLELKTGDKIFQPAFLTRLVAYPPFAGGFEKQIQEEMARPQDDFLGMGARWGRRNRMGGIRYTVGAPGHNYYALVPPSIYMKDHPEYYALINGKRSQDPYTQLCTTNPDVRRIATETVLKWIREGARDPFSRMVCVTPNDTPSFCECERCITEREGGNGIIENIISFSNHIAREVRKEFSDYYIVTLANYDSPHAPKKIKPEPNIRPFVTQWAVDQSKPVTEQERTINAIRDWGAFGNPLYMYTYYGWMPFFWPMVQNISVDIPYFYTHGARHLYAEIHGNWGLQNLNYFIAAELLWDPDADVDKLLVEYYTNFFGPAAKPMQRFYELMERISAERGADGDMYQYSKIWTPDVFDSLEKELRDARNLLKNADPIYNKRLEIVELSFQLAKYLLACFRAKITYTKEPTDENKKHALELNAQFRELLANPLTKQIADVNELNRLNPIDFYENLNKDNTLFTIGEFNYDESFDGGGGGMAPIDSVKLTGFISGRWGLELNDGTEGELLYNFRCVPDTEFEKAWLKGLWVTSLARIDLSTDGGKSWTVVLEKRITKGEEIDISNLVQGKASFLLRCRAEKPGGPPATIFDNIGVRGKVVPKSERDRK